MSRTLSTISFSSDDAEGYLHIIALKGEYVFGIKSSQDIHILFELYSIFEKKKKNNISYVDIILKIRSIIKNKIFNFVKKYSNQYPHLHELRKLFEKLDDNDYIFVIPSKSELIYFKQDINLYIILESLTSKINLHTLTNDFRVNNFYQLHEKYVAHVATGEKSHYVGEKDKSKRVCRYCGKSKPSVSFRKKAHTISEALGNKQFVTRDECDTCNENFGKGIERSMVEFFNIFRNLFSIHGKGGVPDVEGKNFRIDRLPGGTILIPYYIPESFSFLMDYYRNTHPRQYIPLISKNKIIEQDIYRCLVKYALGLLDPSHLHSFNKTIAWINKDFDIDDAPPIAICTSHVFFDKHPSLIVYIRKEEDEELPYAFCEFHFACFVMIAIIPTFKNYERKFNDADGFDSFWKFLPFSMASGWCFKKFLNTSEKNFATILEKK